MLPKETVAKAAQLQHCRVGLIFFVSLLALRSQWLWSVFPSRTITLPRHADRTVDGNRGRRQWDTDQYCWRQDPRSGLPWQRHVKLPLRGWHREITLLPKRKLNKQEWSTWRSCPTRTQQTDMPVWSTCLPYRATCPCFPLSTPLITSLHFFMFFSFLFLQVSDVLSRTFFLLFEVSDDHPESL